MTHQNPLTNQLITSRPRLISSLAMTETVTVREAFTTKELLCNLLFRFGYPWSLYRLTTMKVPMQHVLVVGGTYVAHPSVIAELGGFFVLWDFHSEARMHLD